jgi:sirohydrochlorin cobaltochelatase
MDGLILFAHGARDARWAEPLQRVVQRVVRKTSVPVQVAFLEIMSPDLLAAVAALHTAGATNILVVPVFLGQGGHVREDLVQCLDAARNAYPGMSLTSCPAIGEDDAVLDAIASYCVSQLDHI